MVFVFVRVVIITGVIVLVVVVTTVLPALLGHVASPAMLGRRGRGFGVSHRHGFAPLSRLLGRTAVRGDSEEEGAENDEEEERAQRQQGESLSYRASRIWAVSHGYCPPVKRFG
jgi:hypothetical protein